MLEILSLPYASFLLLFPPQVSLRVLDLGFLNVDFVHVGFLNAGDDVLPGSIRLYGVLLLYRCYCQGCGFGSLGIITVYCLGFLQTVATTGFDGEAVRPLALDCVEDVLFFAGGVEGGCEAVLLAGDPAFARVIDLGYVAGGGRDVGAVVELDKRFAVDEAFDV